MGNRRHAGNGSHGRSIYLAAFWHLLFFDALLLLLRFGGMAMVDMLIHAIVLLAATLCLILYRRPYQVPVAIWIIFAITLAIAVIQMIPLPEPLFAMLAPVKHRIVTETAALFPDVAYSTRITFLPGLHTVRLFSMMLDFALIALLFAAPPARAYVFRFWLFTIALVFGTLANLRARDMLDNSPLSMYQDVYGGLVGQNAFAFFSVVLMIFLWVQIISSGRDIFLELKSGSRNDSRVILHQGINIVFGLCCLLLLINGFQIGFSRAGVVSFLVVHGLFVLFAGYGLILRTARERPMILGLIVLIALALIAIFPFGRAVYRIKYNTANDQKRIDINQIGLHYLAEFPVLGTGIAASETLISPLEPKEPNHGNNIRRFHNEYLQTAVELGWPGTVCLVWFLFLITRELVGARDRRRFSDRLFASGALAVFFLTFLYCFFSFPLRITSIRVFLLCTLALAMKRHDEVNIPRMNRLPLVTISTAVLAAIIFFAWAYSYRPPAGGDLPRVKWAVNYGYHYRAPFFSANEDMRTLIAGEITAEEIPDHLNKIEARVLDHLKQQPYSIKGLNLLFMTRVIQHRLREAGYDTEAYLEFKRQAKGIQQLGKDANLSSKSALLFLYASYEPFLTGDEIVEYEALQALAAGRMEDARDMLDDNTETPGL